MNKCRSQPSPPSLPLRFLRWFCRPELLEDIEGDLVERFHQHIGEKGIKKARKNFSWQVVLLCRPGIMRSFASSKNENYRAMFRHNFLMSWRSIKKDKSTSFINLTSLSVGMACALLILLWVQDELKFDKFHKNDQHLYHVMNNVPTPNGILTVGASSALLGQALEDEIPEVAKAAVAAYAPRGRTTPGICTYNGQSMKADELYVTPNFFEVFSYTILEGSSTEVLPEKRSVMISEELANKFFNSIDNALGKTISWDRTELSGDYQISGIFEKVPFHSTMQFDMLFSYQHYYDTYQEISNLGNWGNSNPMTFVLLKNGADVHSFNSKIRDFSKKKYTQQNGETAPWIGSLFARPYSDSYLCNGFENGIQQGGRITYVTLFSIIAAFILVIACINFMNLATAKASRRSKEIGVKKTIGVSKSHLVIQYLGESLFVALIAMIIAILLVFMLIPAFNLLTAKQLSLELGGPLVMMVVSVAVITGLLSGSYPAFILSRLKPIHVLGGFWKTNDRDIWARKGLVIFQFSLSIILVVSVLVLYNQIQFIQNKNMGYNRNNVIRLSNDGALRKNLDIFLQEAEKIRGVQNVATLGNDITDNHSSTSALKWKGQVEGKRMTFYNFKGGYDVFKVFDIDISQGRAFSATHKSDDGAIIFNETAIKAMGLEDPIGEIVNLWGEDRLIVGVVEDFNYQSLYEPVQPCFFLLQPDQSKTLIKIDGNNVPETLSNIETLYHKFSRGVPFEFTFIDEDYHALYASEMKVSILFRYFAGIAILISCLGLYGISVFTAESRCREISIRKVLGASAFGIVRLLSTDFIKVIGVAVVISLPISYVLARDWLNSFAYRMALDWSYFLVAGIGCLTVAAFSVSFQTLRASLINPVNSLKE